MFSNNFLAEPIGLCQTPPAPRNKGNAEAKITYGVIVCFAPFVRHTWNEAPRLRTVSGAPGDLPIPSALAQAADPVPPEIRLKSYVRNQTQRYTNAAVQLFLAMV